MKRGTLVALGLAAAAAGATLLGVRRQHASLAADRRRLLRAGAAVAPDAIPAELSRSQIPAPVARYLRLAIRASSPIAEVRLQQRGTLRTDVKGDRWMAFEADHLVVPPVAGFLWDARVQVAPWLHVRVRDALIEGRGSGHVSLLSAFTVSAAAGGVEMDAGSLHRYLAEAVWYPTALLPRQHLQWTAIDDTRALATLSSHGITVSLEFRFADSGEVTGIFTPARWGSFPAGFKEAAWEGHFRDYRERHGFLVPGEGEVGWYIDGEWRSVWRGTVVGYDVRASARGTSAAQPG